VAEELKKRHKIEIQLDLVGLKRAGIDPHMLVTKRVSGVALGAALCLTLEELQLRYAVHDEVLLITSQERAASDEFMLTRIYPVKDLVLVRNENDEIQVDSQPLVDLIENAIAPKSWVGNGGTGIMCFYGLQDGCLLVVSQAQEVHEGIVNLLGSLRRFGNAAPRDVKDLRLPKCVRPALPYYVGPAPQPVAVAPTEGRSAVALSTSARAAVSQVSPGAICVPQAPVGGGRILTPEMAAAPEPLSLTDAGLSPVDAAINAALTSPTEIACEKTPLRQLVEELKKRHKIEIQLDAAGLRDAGVAADTPVTKHLSNISLGAALRLILGELECGYTIHNEVLLITSPARVESDEWIITKIYPVKDLVLVKTEKGEIQTEMEPLIDLLANMISMKSWVDNGGPPANMIFAYEFQDRCLLIVTQTPQVHKEISELLGALRRCVARDSKQAIHLRLPQLPKAVLTCPPVAQGGGVF
jgi:hypothetical protein